MTTSTAVYILAVLACSHLVTAFEDIQMLIEMTRHGSRMPERWYQHVKWTEGLSPGQLTPIGMRMHYLLGKELRNRYSRIFENGLKPEEYYIRSTSIHRAIESATSHMHGLWDQFSDFKISFRNDDKRIQPPQTPRDTLYVGYKTPLPAGLIVNPIHMVPLHEDTLLMLWDSDGCLALRDKLHEGFFEISRKLEGSLEFKEIVRRIHTKYDMPFEEEPLFSSCIHLSEFVSQDAVNNPNPKIKMNEDLFKFAERCYQAKVLIRYRDLELVKVHNAELVSEIIKKLSDKAEGLTPTAKYHYYSAHDSTLSGILVASGILSPYCAADSLYSGTLSPCPNFPDVASNIIFELIDDNGTQYARMLYNFDAVDVCSLGNKDDKYRCPLQAFIIAFEAYGDADRNKFCLRDDAEKQESHLNAARVMLNTWQISSAVVLVLICLISIGWCLMCANMKICQISRPMFIKSKTCILNATTSMADVSSPK